MIGRWTRTDARRDRYPHIMAGPDTWKIGHLAVSIEGEDPTAGYLKSELSHLLKATGRERGHLRVVVGEIQEFQRGLHLDEHVVGETDFVVERRLIRVGLSAKDASVVRIAPKEKPRSAIRDLPNRLREINYLSAVDRVAKYAVYRALMPAVQLTQLPPPDVVARKYGRPRRARRRAGRLGRSRQDFVDAPARSAPRLAVPRG